MKRFLFSVCALAAVVVGCSKSEVLNRPNAEVPIEFNPYAGRVPVTKAAVADVNTLAADGFQVYAFAYPQGGQVNYQGDPYMNKLVTKPDDTWVYEGRAYWPASFLLDFLAYGSNDNVSHPKKTTKPEEDDLQTINFNVPEVVADQTDLLVATSVLGESYQEGEGKNNGVVNLTFSHLLSRIGFSLKTKDGNTIPVRIESIELSGKFSSAGTVDLADGATNGRPVIVGNTPTEQTYNLLGEGGTYTGTGHPNSGLNLEDLDDARIYNNTGLYQVKNEENVNLRDYEMTVTKEAPIQETLKTTLKTNQDNRYIMLIPATAEKHEAKITVTYSLPCAATFPPITIDLKKNGINFEAGKAYEFKLKVSTNSIEFSVDVEDWDESGLTTDGEGKNDEYQLS